MLPHPDITLELARQRQHEMIAQAEKARLARALQSRRSGEQRSLGAAIAGRRRRLTRTTAAPAVDGRVLATLLVTDIVDSTLIAAQIGDRAWRGLAERHFRAVRSELDRFDGREIDAAGDGVLAMFDRPSWAVRCAAKIIEAVQPLRIEVRAGLHTGEVELTGPSVRGIAVHIANRIADQAAPGEILVSQTVKDVVAGAGIEFCDRGSRVLTGIPGEWRLLSVVRSPGVSPAPFGPPMRELPQLLPGEA
jgi:class 3 adenylate cyclase